MLPEYDCLGAPGKALFILLPLHPIQSLGIRHSLSSDGFVRGTVIRAVLVWIESPWQNVIR
jgi:hypothetical protein